MLVLAKAQSDALALELRPLIDDAVVKATSLEAWLQAEVARSQERIDKLLTQIADTESIEERESLAEQARAAADSMLGWVAPTAPDPALVRLAHVRYAESMGLSPEEADEFASLMEAQ